MHRTEIARFWAGWLAANEEAQRSQEWGLLADFYTEDATYGWMYTSDEHFMAVGREEIRTRALGTEMAGLEGWHYDYVATVMDEVNQMIVGFWKQRAGIVDSHGREYEVLGIGGSWFGVEEGSDGLYFAWQRDWFDFGSSTETILRIAQSGRAPQGLLDRMRQHGPDQPGHYRLANLPSTIWPPPVEAADAGRGQGAAVGDKQLSR